MKKEFKVSEFCALVDLSTQYFYNIIKRPIPNKVYDPNDVNYEELNKFLMKKFDNDLDQIYEVLDIEDLSDIEIIKGSKIQNDLNKIKIDDLELDEKYIIVSHHYSNTYILKNILEIDEDILYIFEDLTISKVKKDKFRVLTYKELEDERFTIKKA